MATCARCEGRGMVRANFQQDGKYVFHKEPCTCKAGLLVRADGAESALASVEAERDTLREELAKAKGIIRDRDDLVIDLWGNLAIRVNATWLRGKRARAITISNETRDLYNKPPYAYPSPRAKNFPDNPTCPYCKNQTPMGMKSTPDREERIKIDSYYGHHNWVAYLCFACNGTWHRAKGMQQTAIQGQVREGVES